MFLFGSSAACSCSKGLWSWDANRTCQGFGVHRAARGSSGIAGPEGVWEVTAKAWHLLEFL